MTNPTEGPQWPEERDNLNNLNPEDIGYDNGYNDGVADSIESFNEWLAAQPDKREIDRDEISNVFYDNDVICEDCGGSGDLGKHSTGKLISCESCGGDEDSLGIGINIDKISELISNKLKRPAVDRE